MRDEGSFDYVIIGAGSAGCVLANRLTADPGVRVLLLEAGPRDRTWKIHMPAALTYNLRDDKYNWSYETEPQPHMDGRRLYWPRGRVLGGSSSLNAMVYVRGHALDYDRWAGNGLTEWSYAHVLPYFKRAETCARGGDAWRGGDGPLHVSRGAMTNPLFTAFIEAGQQAGYPATADMNGFQQEGFGAMDMTIHRGRRWSAAAAYLQPALTRPNLIVATRAHATRILFAGARAIGVEFRRGGRLRRVMAQREVILSGGAVNSPQLLLLSGVGPADEIGRHGIPVVLDLPGVGRNLQDHLEFYVQYACTKPITLYLTENPLNRVRIGLEWFLFKSGLGTSAHLEAGAFIRRNDAVPHPDLQYHFLPSLVNDHGRKPIGRHAFQAHVGPMRPTSVGTIRLRSADPTAPPEIQPCYLSSEQDRREMRDAVALTRDIFAQPAFDSYRGAEIQPGPEVRSEADIDAFIRAKADSAYHPSCTCKMGADEMAVVDGSLRVHGLAGLRVVDASVMPSIISGNLNAPTIMIAEKAADSILGRPPLAPEYAAVYAPRPMAARRTVDA
ncbi:MAG: choline dehydrogenase [Alphaproteobacteria bacterium]|nr:choline dehydrogenase [Alphaproteobacteria bacterium]